MKYAWTTLVIGLALMAVAAFAQDTPGAAPGEPPVPADPAPPEPAPPKRPDIPRFSRDTLPPVEMKRTGRSTQGPTHSLGDDLWLDEIVGLTTDENDGEAWYAVRTAFSAEFIGSVTPEYLPEWVLDTAKPLPVTRLRLVGGATVRVIGPAGPIRDAWSASRSRGVQKLRFEVKE